MSNRNRQVLSWQLPLVVTVFALYWFGVFEQHDLISLDARMRMRQAEVASQSIVMVGITRESIQKVGPVPWPRSRYATLVKQLKNAGAKTICFDIFFPETGSDVEDDALVAAVSDAGNVILPVFAPAIPDTVNPGVARVSTITRNFPALRQAAIAEGHINISRQADGKVRAFPPAINSGAEDVLQIGIASIAHYLDVPADSIHVEGRQCRIDQRRIPVTAAGIMVNFRNQDRTLAFYPAHSVLSGDVPAYAFRDKLVIVAQTTHGLPNSDLVPTPSGWMFGAFVQAIAMDTLLKQNYIRRIDRTATIIVCLLLLWACMQLQIRTPVRWTVVGYIGIGAAYLITSIYLFNAYGVIIDILPMLVTLFGCFIIFAFAAFIEAGARVRQQDRQFEALLEASQITADQLTVDNVPDLLTGSIRAAVGTHVVSLFRVIDGQPILVSSSGDRPLSNEDAEFESRLMTRVLDERLPMSGEGIGQKGGKSHLSVPLILRDRVEGIINLHGKQSSPVCPGTTFSNETLRIVGLYAHQTGIILENIRLIRELRGKNAALNEALDNLKAAQVQLVRSEKLSAVGGMAAMIVHDALNPIGAIGGFAQLIGMDPNDEEAADYADEINKQVDRVTAMLREIVDFSKDQLVLQASPTPIPSLFQDVQSVIGSTVDNLGVQLQIDCGVTELVELDSERMTRVLANLVKNAAEAMNRSGVIHMNANIEDDSVILTVSDDGPGIPQELHDTLFEAFVTHGKKHGTGLGLAIVKRIVTEHNGEITFESSPDAGTVFRISLPRSSS